MGEKVCDHALKPAVCLRGDRPVQSSLTGLCDDVEQVNDYPGRKGRSLVGIPSHLHTMRSLSPCPHALYTISVWLGSTRRSQGYFSPELAFQITIITTDLGFPHLYIRLWEARWSCQQPSSCSVLRPTSGLCLLPSAEVIIEEINKGLMMQSHSCPLPRWAKEVCILLTGFLTYYWPKSDALHHFLLELLWPSGSRSFLERSLA